MPACSAISLILAWRPWLATARQRAERRSRVKRHSFEIEFDIQRARTLQLMVATRGEANAFCRLFPSRSGRPVDDLIHHDFAFSLRLDCIFGACRIPTSISANSIQRR